MFPSNMFVTHVRTMVAKQKISKSIDWDDFGATANS